MQPHAIQDLADCLRGLNDPAGQRTEGLIRRIDFKRLFDQRAVERLQVYI